MGFNFALAGAAGEGRWAPGFEDRRAEGACVAWLGSSGYGGAPTGFQYSVMRPEKMRVQLACEELADEANRIFALVASRNHHAADNLRRSAQSALFNVGEAIAAWNPRIKLHVYEIARREANEVRAILRLLVRQQILSWSEARRGYNLAGSVITMLIAAAKSIEAGKGR